jgi:hypothetical protein
MVSMTGIKYSNGLFIGEYRTRVRNDWKVKGQPLFRTLKDLVIVPNSFIYNNEDPEYLILSKYDDLINILSSMDFYSGIKFLYFRKIYVPEIDKNNNLTLPEDYSRMVDIGLGKGVSFMGSNKSHIEIWNSEKWDANPIQSVRYRKDIIESLVGL